MNVELPPISATTKGGVRLYVTPEGNKYPSITTILSVRNKSGLVEWRKRVGDKVANHVMHKAAARGTSVHHMCEDYLNNENIEQIVILCVTEDGTVQEFVKEKYDYLDALVETATEWRSQNETPNNLNGGVYVNWLSD